MISTFDELITFLENSIDKENLGVGITTYSEAIIDFRKKITPDQKREIKKIIQKYELTEIVDLSENILSFEIDSLVYDNGHYHMRKLVQFLKDVNALCEIRSFSSGLTFGLRKT